MFKILISVMLSLCLLLTACSDKNDPTEENLAPPINRVLVIRKVIIPAPGIPCAMEHRIMLLEDPNAKENDNKAYTENEVSKLQRQLKYARALEKVGAVKLVKGEFRTLNFKGEIVKMYGYRLSFTNKASHDVVEFTNGKMGLMAGYLGIDKIVKISAVKTNARKEQSCMVTYTKKVVSSPKWVNDNILNLSGIHKLVDSESSVLMIIGPNGWQVKGNGKK